MFKSLFRIFKNFLRGPYRTGDKVCFHSNYYPYKADIITGYIMFNDLNEYYILTEDQFFIRVSGSFYLSMPQ